MSLPVTIVGGYLGAGKTTLVNHLLRNADGLRLAILVNEFGALPIDEDLIEAQDDTMISIAGGCVCCSYGNDLTLAMMDLAKLELRPDHVVLESSGVAIPGAIAASISLLKDFSVDGIVVLADAETVREQAANPYVGDTIARQLADADIVLLNKADLVPEDDLADTRDWLQQAAANAQVLSAVQGALPPEVLLQSFLGRTAEAGHTHQPDFFETAVLEMPDAADPEDLARMLASQELGLVRAKGFVRAPDGRMHAVQVVGRRWAVTLADAGVSPGIVAIALRPDSGDDLESRLALQLS